MFLKMYWLCHQRCFCSIQNKVLLKILNFYETLDLQTDLNLSCQRSGQRFKLLKFSASRSQFCDLGQNLHKSKCRSSYGKIYGTKMGIFWASVMDKSSFKKTVRSLCLVVVSVECSPPKNRWHTIFEINCGFSGIFCDSFQNQLRPSSTEIRLEIKIFSSFQVFPDETWSPPVIVSIPFFKQRFDEERWG